MSLNHHLPKKISLVPKKHHGFQFLLFLCGLLLPPIAVAVRFGIGKDFFINVFLTICGYFPSHFHNFYIQNIRNNTNRARTPKWALKAGLIDDTDIKRRQRKNAWAKRLDERNLQSSHIGADLAEGEEGTNYDPAISEDPEVVARRRNEGLWTGNDEEYYNEDAAPNQRHWHYPANFEGSVGDGRAKSRKGRSQSAASGDRWERSRNSIGDHDFTAGDSNSNYPGAGATDDDVPEWGKDYGSKKSKKKLGGGGGKKGDSASSWARDNYVQDVQRDDGWGGARTGSSAAASRNGGYDDYDSYSNGRGGGGGGGMNGSGAPAKKKSGGDIFSHEF